MPRLFEGTQDNDPNTSNRIAFGRAGVQYLNMTLANLLAWLNANLTFPAGDTVQDTVEIGNWDMDTVSGVDVSYTPPSGKKVVGFRAYIRPGDAVGTVTDQLEPLDVSDTGTDVAGKAEYAPAPTNQIQLSRVTGGYFDQISYSGTGFNRGYIVISLADV